MSDPCAQEEVIKSLEKGQSEQGLKLDAVLENQKELGNTIKQALDRLTSIIEADIGTRKDVEQGKKEREILFEKARKSEDRQDAVEIRNARCDGLGVFDKFPQLWDFYQAHALAEKNFTKVYDWYQQQQGVKKFLPAAMTILCFLMTAATFFMAFG